MLIRITDGTTTQTLAAGSARAVGLPIGPSGLSISGPVQAQPRTFMRGSAAKFANRGNKTTSIAFSVFYEFASIDVAEAFVCTHRSTVLRAGTLEMESTNGAISQVADAVMLDPAIRQITGVSIRVDYSIQGGAETILFGITQPAAGWRTTFNPNTGTLQQAVDLLATVIYDHQNTPGSYTITAPSGGWLRTFDPATATMQQLFDAIATIANEFTGTASVYTIASNPVDYTLDPNTTSPQDAANVLATFLTILKTAGTIG